eukprot:8689960-Pyramimonas_sp.AAC.1
MRMRRGATAMNLLFIGDRPPHDKLDEPGRVLVDLLSQTGHAPDGQVRVRNDYVCLDKSWYDVAADLNIIGDMDTGLVQEDHGPLVEHSQYQHVARPKGEAQSLQLSNEKLDDPEIMQTFSEQLETAAPGPRAQN